MFYALQTLWYERLRFFPGILAVTFSAVLVGLQCGLLLGLFSSVSLAVDRTRADVWVGSYGVASVDQGQPIPEGHLARLAVHPEVERCETFEQGHGLWIKPNGAVELCMVIGSRLEEGSLGAVRELTPELRLRLSEPGTVMVDESDLGRLGIAGVGATVEVSERQVRVVGLVRGLKGLANAYVLCSIQTARMLLHRAPEQTTYLLGKCRNPAEAAAVVARFRGDRQLSAFTSEEFSLQSRLYWLTKTKAGLALGWTAILGLLVGAAITGQTLSAVTAASLREYAVLRAMGIPRWRMAVVVVGQCFGVGLAGAALALPAVSGLALVADLAGAQVLLPAWLLAGMVVVTLIVALLSGLAAVRLLLRIEPAFLLR
jgi:putative ABC transport system permease protein